MKKVIIKTVCMICAFCSFIATNAQSTSEKKATVVAWDGMAVAGYVNNGGFINFGGPTVKFINKPFSIGFGILPTMRIKEDNVPKGTVKNSIVTPTAGFGFSFIYKHMVLQVPFYYNPKTATSNGKWNPGVGVGYKF
ncbi:MAG TPA: hypothetical protein VIZ28_11910 [Chitinophagaceae bacterium]